MKCNYCDRPATIETGREVYPHRRDLWHLKFMVCRPCDARVGMRGKQPLGQLAKRDLRRARIDAHRWFDAVWNQTEVTRGQAYAWLAKQLGISRKQCHIGEFDEEQCRRVVEVCREWQIQRRQAIVDEMG